MASKKQKPAASGKGKHGGGTKKPPVLAPASTSPIEHVVVLMMENRSFDHMFGFRQGVNGLKGDESNLLDPTKPESTTNPKFEVDNGAPYAVLAGQGPGHSLNAANVQLCNNKLGPTADNPAKNNGFVSNYHSELVFADKVRNPSETILHVVMQSFAPARMPSINALADAFCVCDNWYSEVPGPTQPNRLYMHAATSFGYAHNVWSQTFDGATVFNRLQDAGHKWALYWFDDNDVAKFTQLTPDAQNFKLFDVAFKSDVAAGNLPTYTFIEPRFLNPPPPGKGNDVPSFDLHANSQHAPQDARYGDNLIADVYETLRANEELWMKTALVVVYDEQGGFYDHVVPPSDGIPNPDGINSPPKEDKASFAPKFNFDRLGFRVPAVIASPWIKAGRVDSTRYQHTSIIATLRALFGPWDFLTKRDASANPFHHLFTELNEPRADTPQTLPRAPLPKIFSAPDEPGHPANHGLDATQHALLMSAFNITKSSHPNGPEIDELPQTQGEASEFMRERYLKHFGLGKPPEAKTKKSKRRSAKSKGSTLGE
ncbi:MAG: alkaline phosphatase family protein [Acidobacteria bacterium]|nr:alkaline phosphatase family protein [Acidobacteriota bacterium]